MIKILVLTMLLFFVPGAMAEEIVVFGEIKENLDTGATFDLTSATHPSILYYDFEEGYGRETLSFDVDANLEIVDSSFIYTTQIYPKGTGAEPYIAWLGYPYYVIESGSDWYLSQLLVDEDEDNEHSIGVGNELSLGGGYTLIPEEIDVSGEEVMFSLYSDGENIATDLTVENTWFTYKEDLNNSGSKDNTVVTFYIELVFNGMESSMVQIHSVRIVSTDSLYLDLPDDDLLDGYDITSPDDQHIEIELEDNVDLKKGGSVELLDGRFEFMVNDAGDIGGVVKILDMDIYCPDCPTCPECPEVVDCPECPDCPEVNPTIPTTMPTTVPTETSTPEPTEEPMTVLPGFEAIFAIAGLIAVAYLVSKK